MALRRLKVTLAVHRPEDEGRSDVLPPHVRLTADAIRAIGHHVQVVTDASPTGLEGDLLHVFAASAPDAALDWLRSATTKGLPTVVSPDFRDLSAEWLANAIPAAFGAGPLEAIADRIAKLAAVHAAAAGSPVDRMEHDAPGLLGKLRDMCSMADHVIVMSQHERDRLAAIGIAKTRHSVIPLGTDPGRYEGATGARFAAAHGLRGYILSIGPLEPRKNQLLLVHACRALGRPIALIGEGRRSRYGQTVRHEAPPDTTFLGRIDDDGMLASGMAGAAAFVQPSWADSAPVEALEAAAIGVPLALSRRSAEREYFGGLAEYCDPGSMDSIAAAVRRAIDSDSPGLRTLRRQLVRDKYTWPAVAEQTLLAYRRAMQTHHSRLA